MFRLILGTTSLALLLGGTAMADTVRVANYGGSFGDAMNKICLEPFNNSGSGHTAEQVVTDNMLAQLKIQQDTKNVVWDIAPGAEGEAYITAKTNGWLETFDWAALDPDGKLPAVAKPDHGIASSAYSSTLGIRTDKLPQGKEMKSWADFWNVAEFPGPRSLRNSPVENLEFALMADGVPAKEVYGVLRSEGGVDRAFKKLGEIKPSIVQWWTSAQQPVQGLASGELSFATSFNGRIANLKKDNVPVKIMWDGASLNTSPITIPAGAPNKEGALALIKFCYLDPARMVELSRATGTGSLLPEVVKQFSAEEQADMPTAEQNLAVQLVIDPQFWYENRAKIQKRWEEWMLQ